MNFVIHLTIFTKRKKQTMNKSILRVYFVFINFSTNFFFTFATISLFKNENMCDFDSSWIPNMNNIKCAHIFGSNVPFCLYDLFHRREFTVFVYIQHIELMTFMKNVFSSCLILKRQTFSHRKLYFVRFRLFFSLKPKQKVLRLF